MPVHHVHDLSSNRSVRFNGVSAREALISVAIMYHPDYTFEDTLSSHVRDGFADLITRGHRGTLCIGDWAVVDHGMTVGELAERWYHGMTYDTALPSGWVSRMSDRGFDPRGHFVTLYPKGGLAYMAPITHEGVKMAAIVASASV